MVKSPPYGDTYGRSLAHIGKLYAKEGFISVYDQRSSEAVAIAEYEVINTLTSELCRNGSFRGLLPVVDKLTLHEIDGVKYLQLTTLRGDVDMDTWMSEIENDKTVHSNKLPIGQVLKGLADVANVVQTLNNLGWVHMDIQSKNIIFTWNKSGEVKFSLIDFDRARKTHDVFKGDESLRHFVPSASLWLPFNDFIIVDELRGYERSVESYELMSNAYKTTHNKETFWLNELDNVNTNDYAEDTFHPYYAEIVAPKIDVYSLMLLLAELLLGPREEGDARIPETWIAETARNFANLAYVAGDEQIAKTIIDYIHGNLHTFNPKRRPSAAAFARNCELWSSRVR
ncbi:hypothetical protein CYMTET_39674 [Cymbomonas tetramitiformis]|uniref:Protein kinase domain-containing protein n=1 Tax=Cymbomonas tetramitiformis TaxID=36881 RepID=A0AAE0F5D5_9CHLO|nr:hypothetical protein CYMTET_39674 [Cymbomonas tetramitiformis]